MRHGRSPGGAPYWPAFPWPSFSQLTDVDLHLLWDWLGTLPPSSRANTPHALERGYRGRGKAGLWRTFVHRPRQVLPHDPEWSDSARRGAYLVHTIGHCGGCHTPRTRLGRQDARHPFAGSDAPPHGAPNLTPHPDGLAEWSEGDWETFFELGMLPDGDFAGSGMGRVVSEGTALLSDADRAAIITYLTQLAPLPTAE
ncbi:MAG: mono/diheme cytochrome c family protein [Myxococcota bacterium]|jgi:mono/diheme cytochrome c family protein